jgi:hypothetical protein
MMRSLTPPQAAGHALAFAVQMVAFFLDKQFAFCKRFLSEGKFLSLILTTPRFLIHAQPAGFLLFSDSKSFRRAR